MRQFRVWVLSLLAGLTAVSCQTIAEDLPTASYAPLAPLPVVVVQLPNFPISNAPSATTPPAAANPTAPPANPTSPPSPSQLLGAPVALPTSQPLAAPTIAPPVASNPAPANPTAPPAAGNGGCEGFPPNCNPVASVHAYVYYIVCGGTNVVDAKVAEEGPANCDVRLDATPKDQYGKHTQAKGSPRWDVSGAAWNDNANKNPYTPLVYGGNGSFTASVEIDGVRSNTFTYRFR